MLCACFDILLCIFLSVQFVSLYYFSKSIVVIPIHEQKKTSAVAKLIFVHESYPSGIKDVFSSSIVSYV